jgi:predicted PurR-regulated permease PerM
MTQDSSAPTGTRATLRTRIFFTVLFLLTVGLTGYVVWPFRAPLFLALVLASVLNGVYQRVLTLLRGRRKTAAVATSLGLLLVIIGPAAAVVGFLAEQVVKGLDYFRGQLGIGSIAELRALPPQAQEMIDATLDRLHVTRAQVAGVARELSAAAETGLERLLRGSSTALFHTAIALIAFYFFLVEGQRLMSWLRRVSPLQASQTQALLDEFRATTRASILGAVLSAIFQGVAAALGFAIAGAPHAMFLGTITLFASFIPVVGTMIVWVPTVVLLWLANHHGAAVLLLVWCVIFLGAAEHVGKPFVLRALLQGRQEMHTGLVFLSLLGGLEMFGLIGIVLGPLVVAFFLAMVRIYERDFSTVHPDLAPAPTPPDA